MSLRSVGDAHAVALGAPPWNGVDAVQRWASQHPRWASEVIPVPGAAPGAYLEAHLQEWVFDQLPPPCDALGQALGTVAASLATMGSAADELLAPRGLRRRNVQHSPAAAPGPRRQRLAGTIGQEGVDTGPDVAAPERELSSGSEQSAPSGFTPPPASGDRRPAGAAFAGAPVPPLGGAASGGQDFPESWGGGGSGLSGELGPRGGSEAAPVSPTPEAAVGDAPVPPHGGPVSPPVAGAFHVEGVDLAAIGPADRGRILEGLRLLWTGLGGPAGVRFELHPGSIWVLVRSAPAPPPRLIASLTRLLGELVEGLRQPSQPAIAAPEWHPRPALPGHLQDLNPELPREAPHLSSQEGGPRPALPPPTPPTPSHDGAPPRHDRRRRRAQHSQPNVPTLADYTYRELNPLRGALGLTVRGRHNHSRREVEQLLTAHYGSAAGAAAAVGARVAAGPGAAPPEAAPRAPTAAAGSAPEATATTSAAPGRAAAPASASAENQRGRGGPARPADRTDPAALGGGAANGGGGARATDHAGIAPPPPPAASPAAASPAARTAAAPPAPGATAAPATDAAEDQPGRAEPEAPALPPPGPGSARAQDLRAGGSQPGRGELGDLLRQHPWLSHAHHLDEVRVEEELGRRFCSLRRVPRALVSALAEKLDGALAALLCPAFPAARAAALWALLPRLLLGAVLDARPAPRARRAPRQRGIRTVLRERLERLAAGELPGLLAESRAQGPAQPGSHGEEEEPAGWARAREMVRLVRSGQVGKAAARLTSAGVAKWSQEVEDRLRTLVVPQQLPAPSDHPLPPDNPVSLSPDGFRRRLKRAPRGSAPGPTGLRSDHLQLLLTDPPLLDRLHAVAERLLNGRLPALADHLSWTILTPLNKGGGERYARWLCPTPCGAWPPRRCATSSSGSWRTSWPRTPWPWACREQPRWRLRPCRSMPSATRTGPT